MACSYSTEWEDDTGWQWIEVDTGPFWIQQSQNTEMLIEWHMYAINAEETNKYEHLKKQRSKFTRLSLLLLSQGLTALCRSLPDQGTDIKNH